MAPSRSKSSTANGESKSRYWRASHVRATPPDHPARRQHRGAKLAKSTRVQKQRHRLESERAALARWMTRLKRAFTFVEKIQRTIGRLERKITQLE
jgi:hypothetical protein